MSELIDRGPATGNPADRADRASGAAQARVIELRVHGVSGTPPEQMLDEPFPRQVAGDDVGRFFRRAKPISVDGFPDRDVEAYHWGRFTSGSPTRALWLLLLPFAVIN